MWGLAHACTPYARVARVLACATRPVRRTGSSGAQPYRYGRCGDTVGAAGRRRGAPAEMETCARLTECRMADWGRNPRGQHPGGEEYNNGPFCPPGAALAIHPDT